MSPPTPGTHLEPPWLDFSLYTTGFNAPWDAVDSAGNCDAACEAEVSAWNMWSWQPQTETLGAGATYSDAPFGGDYGHWLKLSGGSGARLTLDDPHFDLVWSQEAGGLPSGFSFSAWLLPDAAMMTTASDRGVVETGLFYVWLEFLGDGTSNVHVGLHLNVGGWEEFSFGPADWVAGEQNGLFVAYDNSEGLLTVSMTEPVVGSGGTSRTGEAAFENSALVSGTPTLGATVAPVVIGDVDGPLIGDPAEPFDGWIDDVQLLRGLRD